MLRNTVLVMIVLFLFKALYLAPTYLSGWLGSAGNPKTRSFLADLRLGLRRRPILVTALIFGLVYVIATFTSLEPRISFWGSYDRQEGTYTYLTYIVLFLLIASHLRHWVQVERLVTTIVFASIPVCAYSWLQHFNNDPLVWADASQSALRTPSTMGNPIFLAAYVLMTVPFTLYRLVLRYQQFFTRDRQGNTDAAIMWTGLGLAGTQQR